MWGDRQRPRVWLARQLRGLEVVKKKVNQKMSEKRLEKRYSLVLRQDAGASHRIEQLAVDRPLAAASGAWGASLKWTLSTPLSIWAWGAPSIARCPSKEECHQSECRHGYPFAAEK